jgi:hypothetical protein
VSLGPVVVVAVAGGVVAVVVAVAAAVAAAAMTPGAIDPSPIALPSQSKMQAWPIDQRSP